MNSKPDILSIMEREGIVLHKAGRAYRCKCPMHDGKTDGSLAVYPDTQSWYCFGCGEGGDVVDFIMKQRGLSFKDACVHLGIRPGRPVPVDPAIHRRKTIQKQFQENLQRVYFDHCDRAVQLHKLRIQVKKNPGAMTDAGMVSYSLAMGELDQIEYKIDAMLYGSVEDQISEIGGTQANVSETVERRAAYRI
jgi:hypothetical protein